MGNFHNESATLLIDQAALTDLIIELTRNNDNFRPAQRPEENKSIKIEQNASAQAGSADAFKPLPELPPGPWRSLGGYFDYSKWSEKERFLELDHAILAAPD